MYVAVWALLHIYTAIMRVVFLFRRFHALYSYLLLDLSLYNNIYFHKKYEI